MAIQSMPDASPAKWHLGHTTWFFETFMLMPKLRGYQPYDASFSYLFNSYYEALGPRQPRPFRGLLSRPTVDQVMAYRAHVDAHMLALLDSHPAQELAALMDLGLAHEEQHQELLLMDILHLFAQSPLKPAYDARWPRDRAAGRGRFVRMEGAWSRSATRVTTTGAIATAHSRSTTNCRATRPIWRRSRSATGS